MMMNQIKYFAQPFDTPSSVIANDVLLHMAARMDANPAALPRRRMLWNSAAGMSALCLPNPRLTHTDCSALDATRVIYTYQYSAWKTGLI